MWRISVVIRERIKSLRCFLICFSKVCVQTHTKNVTRLFDSERVRMLRKRIIIRELIESMTAWRFGRSLELLVCDTHANADIFVWRDLSAACLVFCVLYVESVRTCFKCTHSRVCFVCYAILFNMLYATMRCVFVWKWYNVVWRWRPEVYFSVFCVCPEHQKVVSSCILLGCHLSSKMIWNQYQHKYSASSFRVVWIEPELSARIVCWNPPKSADLMWLECRVNGWPKRAQRLLRIPRIVFYLFIEKVSSASNNHE